ncbi:MAG TPA: hypothetical protein VIK39_12180 [Candidatus Angelobacter sp.]
MPLRDYVYIDKKRLNSYENQIGSPVTYDKVPIWKLMFSVAGPTVQGEQRRDGRQRTDEEKITLLLEYLQHKKELGNGRVSGQHYYSHAQPVFRFEKCRAVKIEIPIDNKGQGESRLIVLWLSATPAGPDPENGESRLFLMQNDGQSDDTKGYSAGSAYSTLQALYDEDLRPFVVGRKDYRQQRTQQIVKDLFKRDRMRAFTSPSPLDRLRGRELDGPEAIASEADRLIDRDPRLLDPTADGLRAEFALNPVAVLQKLGARNAVPYEIETLYRIRNIHIERGEAPITVTLAYPVFIAP